MAVIKITTALRLAEDMHYKITYIAKKEHRSLNAQMEHLAARCIQEYEAENGPIEIPDNARGTP